MIVFNALVGSIDPDRDFVDISVPGWAWLALLGFIAFLLCLDLLVFHRRAHEVHVREALVESIVWIGLGLSFTVVVAIAFGGGAAGEYISGYLIEKSLSVDNVFVWALILGHFRIPNKYQHRVLFWGIFGALAMRAVFIFAGVALIEKFEWVLYLFGGFLVYTAVKLMREGDDEIDPASGRFMKFINRFVPTSPDYDGQKLFTRVDGRRLATPLFAVIILIEFTDVLFAVDSVPAVLAVSREQFIVFSSNAFAILGLRALYFLLADAQARFTYLKHGLSVILAFVGVKMLMIRWYHISTPISLGVIALVLAVAIGASLRTERDGPDSRGTSLH
ncbi:MAG: TerC family protein [Actinomycetota bacterium]